MKKNDNITRIQSAQNEVDNKVRAILESGGIQDCILKLQVEGLENDITDLFSAIMKQDHHETVNVAIKLRERFKAMKKQLITLQHMEGRQ